jgi:hypothetical protein
MDLPFIFFPALLPALARFYIYYRLATSKQPLLTGLL